MCSLRSWRIQDVGHSVSSQSKKINDRLVGKAPGKVLASARTEAGERRTTSRGRMHHSGMSVSTDDSRMRSNWLGVGDGGGASSNFRRSCSGVRGGVRITGLSGVGVAVGGFGLPGSEMLRSSGTLDGTSEPPSGIGSVANFARPSRLTTSEDPALPFSKGPSWSSSPPAQERRRSPLGTPIIASSWSDCGAPALPSISSACAKDTVRSKQDESSNGASTSGIDGAVDAGSELAVRALAGIPCSTCFKASVNNGEAPIASESTAAPPTSSPSTTPASEAATEPAAPPSEPTAATTEELAPTAEPASSAPMPSPMHAELGGAVCQGSLLPWRTYFGLSGSASRRLEPALPPPLSRSSAVGILVELRVAAQVASAGNARERSSASRSGGVLLSGALAPPSTVPPNSARAAPEAAAATNGEAVPAPGRQPLDKLDVSVKAAEEKAPGAGVELLDKLHVSATAVEEEAPASGTLLGSAAAPSAATAGVGAAGAGETGRRSHELLS
mmetsp:Transcript_5740/g.21821  ORF Transcript_5740/g.21821 Transcript_5740/m.21821 type:complete len:501 (-) Transcript_5740:655-2157(-)